ncbi:hypothetical protein [Candidatus Symbiopectobacterium sp.]|uniref:hypothetical protein n=1 Tax=Candidatus Symbiopectobacterium sp. TaxID=2816440 RepID=UPI0025BB2D48|nr:hypothetical protein [Candidatus Symbiopectobacterium sp.]
MEICSDDYPKVLFIQQSHRKHPISVTEWMDERKREAFKSKSGYEFKCTRSGLS